jgi:hypothetical protein
MALTKKEQEQLDALTKKASEPDEPEESGDVWEHPDGSHGTKLTGKRYRTWLAAKFPDIFAGLADDEEVGDVEVSADPEPKPQQGKTHPLFQGKRTG